jgi:hypothetical protein
MPIPVSRQEQQLKELIARKGKPVSAEDLHELAMAAGLDGFPDVDHVKSVLAGRTSEFSIRAGNPTRWYLYPEDPLLSGRKSMADSVSYSSSEIVLQTVASGSRLIRDQEIARRLSLAQDDQARKPSETRIEDFLDGHRSRPSLMAGPSHATVPQTPRREPSESLRQLAVSAIRESGYPLTLEQIATAIAAHDQVDATPETVFQAISDVAPRWRIDDAEPPRYALPEAPLLPQYAIRLFDSEMRSPRWRPLNMRVQNGVSWSDFNMGSYERLCEIDVDNITFFVWDPQGISRILRLDVDHVLGEEPVWIASILLSGASLALATDLRVMGWHLWPSENEVNWSARFSLIEPDRLRGAQSPLATWRSNTPSAVMIAVTNLLAHLLGPRDLNRIECKNIRCSPAEQARRRRDLFALGGPRHVSYDATGRTQKPILAHCAICGHALSDPTSAALGVGPECRRQSPAWYLTLMQTNPTVPAQFWIGGQPLESWRAAVSTRRAVRLE